MKNVVLFLGGFGSGKTECAVNYAIAQAKKGHKVALADMDIVNPMFRTTFFAGPLREAGVDLIASESMLTFEGLPIVPETVRSLFYDDHDLLVFDVGGDKIGAIALGQYHKWFQREDINRESLFVCNIRRPAQDTVERMCNLYETVRSAGRIEIDGLVNNSNMGEEAVVEDLIEGQALIAEFAKVIGKPIAYLAGTKKILDQLEEEYPDICEGKRMELQPRPRLPWTI